MMDGEGQMRRARLTPIVVLGLMTGIVLGAGEVVVADSIAPGFDLFATIQPTDVCLDAPVCLLRVALMGEPIGSDTDTIVRRHQGLDTFPGTIQIELIALSLRSIEPVRIGDRLFDLSVRELPSPRGTMTVRHEGPNGGTFDAFMPVMARLTFTEVNNPANRFTRDILDELRTIGLPTWSHTRPDGYPEPPQFPAGRFYPGTVTEQGLLARHSVRPARVPEPSTLVLLGSGLGWLVAFRRKRLLRKPKIVNQELVAGVLHSRR